jgi:2,4-dienoyl-CoA reductase-like NADH-dependent reductase (Old Yellow Enzyme family)
MTDDPLFDSVDIGGLTLDTRVGLAPMTRTSADDDGRATERMARYYATFARGGFGVVVTEGVHTDTAESQGYPNQPGLATDEQAAAWAQVTEAVHDEGAPIVAQLMHAGPLVQGNRYTDETVAPSPVQPKGEQLGFYGGEGAFDTPRELGQDDLDAIRESFVAAAERAVDAGFDGVELHGANGYLLDSFLTAYTNQRADEYGGSVENRVRFPAEVAEAVVDAVPEEFVVGIRLSQTKVNDDGYRWSGPEEAETIVTTLVEQGLDYVHVTEEPITDPAFAAVEGVDDDDRTLADLAVEFSAVPVVANGGLGDPEAARDVLEHGADLVTLGKSALANPDWPERVRAGESLADFDFERFLVPRATIGDHEVPGSEQTTADD